MSEPRLFLALKLPPNFLKRLEEYQNQLDQKYFKIIPLNQLHLTLLFLGETPLEKVEPLKQVIERMAADFQPSPLIFETIEYGPFLSNPRLIWLKGIPNSSFINFKTQLRNEIQKELKLDLSADQQVFLPHITLARFKNHFATPLPPLPDSSFFYHFSFVPNQLWLIQSILHKTGPQYFDLAQFKL